MFKNPDILVSHGRLLRTSAQQNNYFLFSVCTLDVELADLSDNAFCTLSSKCNAIDCCLKSKLLQRNFAASLSVDQCSMVLTVAIEKLQFEIRLLDFEWGMQQTGLFQSNKTI